jgi:hypothetical protein
MKVFLIRDGQSHQVVDTEAATVSALASEQNVIGDWVASVNGDTADSSTTISDGNVVSFSTANKKGGS